MSSPPLRGERQQPSLAPQLQHSLLSGRDLSRSPLSPIGAGSAPRADARAVGGSPSPPQPRGVDDHERVRVWPGGQLVLRPLPREESAGARIEVSALSDLAGHGRYAAGDEESAWAAAQQGLLTPPPPTEIPEKLHVRGPGGELVFPSAMPTSRAEVAHLSRAYDTLLRAAGDDPHAQLDARDIALSELARQEHVHCAERAQLLLRLRHLYYAHTAEALPKLDRMESVEHTLQERLEQLEAMRSDHAALTASRNRLSRANSKLPTRRQLSHAVREERAHKAPNPLISEFRRIRSVADRLQLLSEVVTRLDAHEQLSVLSRALESLPKDQLGALIAEQLEVMGPGDVVELLHTSLREAADAGGGREDAGVLQIVLEQLPARKMIELVDQLVAAWSGDGAQYAITLFEGLSTDDRLSVLSSFRSNLSDEEYIALLGHGLTERQKDTLKTRLAQRAQQRAPAPGNATTADVGCQASPEEAFAPLVRDVDVAEAIELAARSGQAVWVPFDSTDAWARFASAEETSPVDALDADQIRQSIAELYEDKLRANRTADLTDQSRTGWAQFVYIWMMQRHMVKSRAAHALGALLDGAVRHAASSQRIANFAILCGLQPGYTINPSRVDAVLGVLGTLFPNEVGEKLANTADGELTVPFRDSTAEMSATEALQSVKERHLATYVQRMVRMTEEHLLGAKSMVDVDSLVLLVIETCEEMFQKQAEGLALLFKQADVNNDGRLSLDEFASICAKLNPTVAAEHISSLFLEVQEASEAIEPTIGDALHPQAFVRIMQSAEDFLDTELFLDFLREHKLMKHEEEQ